MNKIIRNGIVLPLALGMLLATSLGAAASPARDNDARKDRREQREDAREQRRDARKEKRQERRDDRRQQRHDVRRPAVVVRPEVRHVTRPPVPQVTRREFRQDNRQDRRDQRHENRQDRRDDRHDRRQDRREARHDIRQDRREFRQDQRERRAQARYRDDYYRRLRLLQSRHYTPYWYRSGNYRYMRGGHWYRVNHYGADLLRRAIDQGYREGLRAGRADRYDGWYGDYRRSFAWIDGSFGYYPGYVSRSEYNYYFRQGFQRGYEDGYYGRMRYGRSYNGEAIIVDAVVRAILDLQRW